MDYNNGSMEYTRVLEGEHFQNSDYVFFPGLYFPPGTGLEPSITKVCPKDKLQVINSGPVASLAEFYKPIEKAITDVRENSVVIGHSLGGSMAVLALQRNPGALDKIKRVVLYNPDTFVDPTSRSGLKQALMRSGRSEESIDFLLEGISSELKDEILLSFTQLGMRPNVWLILGGKDTIVDPNVTRRFHSPERTFDLPSHGHTGGDRTLIEQTLRDSIYGTGTKQ